MVQIPSHRFSDSIDPYMQLVSVLCSPVSSIPTSLSFFKSFCPCFHPFFILHIVQAHAQQSSQVYVGLLFDSIAFLKKVDVVKTLKVGGA